MIEWIVYTPAGALKFSADDCAVTPSGAIVIGNTEDNDSQRYMRTLAAFAPGEWRYVQRLLEAQGQ